MDKKQFFNLMEMGAGRVAVIVAHPDDETLWAGGAILNNPQWHCFVACLCRKNDADRAPKFEKVLKVLGAAGAMGDMDDGPEQIPLPDSLVADAIMALLPHTDYDLVITHSIYGEYTRHRRHEEIGRAVINLWHSGRLSTKKLWAFAYEDGNRAHYPLAIPTAPVCQTLPPQLWEQKYNIITEIYGFRKDSWEAQATPAKEAFWQFNNVNEAKKWLDDAI